MVKQYTSLYTGQNTQCIAALINGKLIVAMRLQSQCDIMV